MNVAAPATGPARTFSLRSHLLLLVLGTAVPALAVAGVLVQQVVTDNRTAVEQRLIQAARAEAAMVDAELTGTVRALQGLGESDRLTTDELPQFYEQAQRLLATQPVWAAVDLSTPDGHQIANTQRALGEPLPFVTDPESFERVVTPRAPAIGNLRVGNLTRQRGFPVRVPVVRNGQVKYVLSAWITSERFATVLREQPVLPDEWVRGVVDPAGVVVARSKDADRFVGQRATEGFLKRFGDVEETAYRDTALDGTSVYGAFARAPVSRWVAGIAVPASTINASFRQSMLALAGVTLLLLAIGGGGTYIISRRVSRDLWESTAAANAIAGGERPSVPRSSVTELQQLIDALTRSSNLLETRRRERDEQLARADAARAEAEAADRAKDQFLAMLGHELRNPLAPALTAVHLMKVKGGQDSSRQLEVLERQIRHMARLVDDLLDVSRLRRGAIELRRERFDVSEAVARAVEMTSPLFAEKGHHLDVDVPAGLTIDADRIRIAQVLSNVLTNAAKYTEPGGHVEVRARRSGDTVTIECCDDGIGLSADLVPHVFDLFVQGERGLDRREGGLGLGLAVARTLVDLHGGSIVAKSDGPGCGSTFVMTLPLAAAQQGLPIVEPAGASTAVPRRTGRVLVVDDNADARDMLMIALESAGYKVAGAATGAEAMEQAARFRPEVAVLDIGLPDVDGFVLARSLRARDDGAGLRLIALTGYGREQDIAAAHAAGFDLFFVKPVELSLLLDAVAPSVR